MLKITESFFFRKVFLWQYISSFVETVIAVVASLLLFEPQNSLELIACPVVRLSDWYTLFSNPKIKFSKTIYCTQEAVFPL